MPLSTRHTVCKAGPADWVLQFVDAAPHALGMLNTSLSPWPAYSEEEVEAVSAVLRSNRVNYWTGTITREFERQFAGWAGTSRAIALANGTVALDLALKALDLQPGDEVVVTPRTFLASVSCVLNAGATPIFADIDMNSGNITPETTARVLTPCTRAVIPVHLGGWPADMKGFNTLADKHGFHIIEDCAQAHGASIDGKSVGSWGTVAAWSFCQDKIVTTGGEGGMVTTDREDLWRAMWAFKDHGKSFAAVYERDHPPGYRWLHESIGTNWRMTEIQAVIGQIQLSRMAEWTAARTRNAHRIRESLLDFPDAVRVPLPEVGLAHAFYRLYAYIRPDGLAPGWSRDRIVAEFIRRNIPVGQGSCSEVYREKAFEGTGLVPIEPLPAARELGETSLAFLVHPGLTDKDLDLVCNTVRSVFLEAAA